MNDNRTDGSPGAGPTELKPVIVWTPVLAAEPTAPANAMEESAIRCAVAALQTDDRQAKLSLLAAAGRYANGARGDQ
ncbi:MAG TPA: hypothetical protein PKX06_08885 [Phenylobacterium sp.]|nr:hypothetical protein [Phenylobacterium sp.]